MKSSATSLLPTFDISFRAEDHSYTDSKGRGYTSVTTVLKGFKQPFDSAFWANKKAKERGVTPDVILDEWAANAKRSTDHGTRIHKGIEDFLNGVYDWSVNPLSEAYVRFLATHELPADYYVNEFILCDPESLIAGTADFIVFNPDTKEFLIMDWKTNKEIRRTNNYNQKMLGCLDCLPDCELSVYTMQLNIYANMLEMRGWTCRGLELVHLKDDVVTIIPIERMKHLADKVLFNFIPF